MFIDSHFLGTGIEWQSGEKRFSPISAQPPKDYAPLIWRVARAARVLGAGLGFPVGAPAVFTPNLRLGNARLCSQTTASALPDDR